ncbi:response regulator [bacterium]|nr:response regulator [bacterium]
MTPEIPKILIVDDVPENLFLLEACLSDYIDVDFIRAENGKEALATIDELDNIALAILDVDMPGMNGFELAELIHRGERTKLLPIIFLSAVFTNDFNISEGYTRGAVDYLTKPFNIHILLSKVKVFLDLFTQRKQLEEEIIRRRKIEDELRQIQAELENRVKDRTKELLQTNENLIIAKNTAELANHAKSVFLANMSHELRTPLHHVLSFSKFGIAKTGLIPTEEIKEYFTAILESGSSLLTLLNDLLDLARLESGKVNYLMEKEELKDIISVSIEECREMSKKKDISIELEAVEISTDLVCSVNHIKQVMRNLLSNAIKFTPKGEKITVSIKSEELPTTNNETVSALCTTIKDYGIGIPENELDTIFEKFNQSSKSKTGAGGTGLGLSICREIVHAHKGTIEAKNNPGGGALFSFTLPCDQKEAKAPNPQVSP